MDSVGTRSWKKSTFSCSVIFFPGLLGDHTSDNEAECCDVRWDSKMDSPSGGTLKRTPSSCQPEGASVTSAATPRLCSGRLKICLLALVLLHTVIIISASHNSTLLDVAAIFSPEEGASNEEWTAAFGIETGAYKKWRHQSRIKAGWDTSGETCWRCHCNLLPTNRPSQNAGGFWTGAKGAGTKHRPNQDVFGPPAKRTDFLPLETCSLFLSHPIVF